MIAVPAIRANPPRGATGRRIATSATRPAAASPMKAVGNASAMIPLTDGSASAAVPWTIMRIVPIRMMARAESK